MSFPLAERSVAAQTTAAARAELERRILIGRLRSADDLRSDFPEVWADSEAALELVYAEYVARAANGESPRREEWYERFPQWRERLSRLFELYDLMADAGTHPNRTDVTRPTDLKGTFVGVGEPDGYELLGELGRGGMAVVYKARQVELDRLVALKMIRGGGWFQTEDVDRIRREAQAAARLQHPNIVQVHEVGNWDGMPFMAMEYVSGGTLADALARAGRPGGMSITPVQAAELIEQLARAMQYAHDRGIIHRDLKPANVLLAGDPDRPLASPKVADFGLALIHNLSPTVSQTATLAGTPAYMAPEQADSSRGTVGPQADVYALGGILFELIAGRPPFQGATVLETLDLVRGADPVSPRLLRPQIPRDLETICLKCLQKSPPHRYGTAAALADDLGRFRAGRPITARPVGMLERTWKWCRRRPVVAGLLGCLAAAVVAAVVLPTVFWQRAEIARAAEADLRRQSEEREAQLLLRTARLQWLANDLDGARETLVACDLRYRDAEWAYLWRACRPPLVDIRTGDQPGQSLVHEMLFSSDGNGLLVARQSSVRVWNPVDGSEISIIPPRSTANKLAYPRQHELIEIEGVGSAKGTRISRLNLLTGKQQLLWQSAVRTDHVRVSPECRFAAIRVGSVLSLVDLTTGEAKTVSRTAPIARLVITPGAAFIGLLELGRVVSVWDTAAAQEAFRIVAPAGPERVGAVAINPSCTRAAYTVGKYGRPLDVAVYSRGRETPDTKFSTGLTSFDDVQFSPDGRLLAISGDENRFVRVWNSFTGEEVVTLRGHQNRVMRYAFSPDSRRLAIACAGGRVAIWGVTRNDN